MLQYRANKCVFKSLWKLSLVTLGSLKLSGNRLSSRPTGQPQKKPVGRTLTCNRWRVSTRSHWLADLRCCREATSKTGRQRSMKYCGAWPCRQLCTTMMQSLYVTDSGTLSNELGNEPSLEIAGFCIFPISNTADEGKCSIAVLLMLVS